jgi:hypothetical protein
MKRALAIRALVFALLVLSTSAAHTTTRNLEDRMASAGVPLSANVIDRR